jgi:limonene-1,2-epoxide hydrolase
MSSNAAITQDFIKAWTDMNIDKLMEFFTDDAVYTNIPMDPPNKGKQAIRTFIEGFMGMASEMEFIVHNQIEGPDGVVMNERTDRLCLNDKWVELPVMGVFEFTDGKISAWRDYFDMAKFTE